MRISLSLLKLRLGMIATTALVITVSSLILLAALDALGIGVTGAYGLTLLFVFVLGLYLMQWLFAPYIIDALYHCRPLSREEAPELHEIVEKLSARAGLSKPPKLMLAEVDAPNAFAYGSPLTGNRIAVTRGLLKHLPLDEIEAVLGHELGHIKHRDVLIMTMIGVLPLLVYYIGRMLMWAGFFGGGRRDEGGPLYLFALGVLLTAVSFVLNIFILHFSRLREYFADAHSAMVVEDGARKLQRALARIMVVTGALKEMGINVHSSAKLKAFMIEDPDHAVAIPYFTSIDEVVEAIKRSKPSLLQEIFSTHPHPAKRLRFLDRLVEELSRY